MARLLDGLYAELQVAQDRDEDIVCRIFSADSKPEAIRLITGEIELLEEELKGFSPCGDDGMDYDALCRSQGLSRFA